MNFFNAFFENCGHSLSHVCLAISLLALAEDSVTSSDQFLLYLVHIFLLDYRIANRREKGMWGLLHLLQRMRRRLTIPWIQGLSTPFFLLIQYTLFGYLFVRVAATGVVFSMFLVLHLTNLLVTNLGPEAYDGLQHILRHAISWNIEGNIFSFISLPSLPIAMVFRRLLKFSRFSSSSTR